MVQTAVLGTGVRLSVRGVHADVNAFSGHQIPQASQIVKQVY